MQDYAHLVKVAIDYAKEKGGSTEEQVKLAMDKCVALRFFSFAPMNGLEPPLAIVRLDDIGRLAVTVGAEILKLIPGAPYSQTAVLVASR